MNRKHIIPAASNLQFVDKIMLPVKLPHLARAIIILLQSVQPLPQIVDVRRHFVMRPRYDLERIARAAQRQSDDVVRAVIVPDSASVTGFSGNADIQPAKASTIPPPANTAPQRLANQRIIRR